MPAPCPLWLIPIAIGKPQSTQRNTQRSTEFGMIYIYKKMSKEEEIVVFETYYNPMLAEIIRAKLEANGIPCFLSDESIGTIYPVYNQGAGGIKLKVFARDVEKCREIVDRDDEIDEQTTYL